MTDRIFYPLAALIAVLMIALAAVFPQGIGARSPGPFGHETAAEAAARLKRAAPKPAPPQPSLRGPL